MTALSALAAILNATGIPRMSLSGSLGATGSTSTITSTSRTITVPSGNAGTLTLDNPGGTGTLELNVNGAGYTSGGWTASDGQSIQARASGLSSVSDFASGDLTDTSAGVILATITITRTS